jgi:hypothetical protein
MFTAKNKEAARLVQRAAAESAVSRYAADVCYTPAVGMLTLNGKKVSLETAAGVAVSAQTAKRDLGTAAGILVDRYLPVTDDEAEAEGVATFGWHPTRPGTVTRVVAVQRVYATAEWFPSPAAAGGESARRVQTAAARRASEFLFKTETGVIQPTLGGGWVPTACLASEETLLLAIRGTRFSLDRDFVLLSPYVPVVIHNDEHFLVRVAAYANRSAIIVPAKKVITAGWGAVLTDAGVRR